jgi:O-antigen ligase
MRGSTQATRPTDDLEGAGSPFGSALFPIVVGLFVALCLLKFGNPVVLDHKLEPPSAGWEFLIWSWPMNWAYPIVAALFVWAVWRGYRDGWSRNPAARPAGSWRWVRLILPWLPLAWFFWQCASAVQTVNWPLSHVTLEHFAATTACFYIGFLALGRGKDLALMWWVIVMGLVAVIGVGFDQHFIQLEETRRFVHSQPDWQNKSPEFLRKIASNRIYATLFYPNTLAGALLLFTPPVVASALTLSSRRALGRLLAFLIGFGACACLYWSGSKAGWLIALALGLAATLHASLSKRIKYAVITLLLIFGMAGFLLRNAGYFEKGAKSLGARLDYWTAAVQIVGKHPVFGSGPGTFGVLYRYLKSPEAEMTRLVHNDYLEQASDSGLPGFVLLTGFLVGSLVLLRPHASQSRASGSLDGGGCPTSDSRLAEPDSGVRFAVWLGLAGWAAQSLVEFGLYVPALAWPAFLLLGWLTQASGLHQAPRVRAVARSR